MFVAIPLPLTGVWTGTCFAILLGLNFWIICMTVILGNTLCGVIVAFVCQVFPQITDILLIIFLILILLAMIVKVISHVLKKRRTVTTNTPTITENTATENSVE